MPAYLMAGEGGGGHGPLFRKLIDQFHGKKGGLAHRVPGARECDGISLPLAFREVLPRKILYN